MPNDLTFYQASALVNAIQNQATGRTNIAPTDLSSFITVAQATLKTGYDPVIGAISQMISDSIIRVRPYTRKFQEIEATNMRYGNAVRKISFADKDFEDNLSYKDGLPDGTAVDHYKINKPIVLQMNYYGHNTYSKSITFFKNQLDSAFSSPENLLSFVAGVTQNIINQLEQARENCSRATVTNFIAGKVDAGNNVIYLIEEYNTETGLALTKEDLNKPENYAAFMRWAFAYVNTISDQMTERTNKFHINITGKPITRHTPYDRQIMYIFAPTQNKIDSQVMATTFNMDKLKMMKAEKVNFWQSIDTPGSISAKPVYIDSDGEIVVAAENVVLSDIFGVLFDIEAMGTNLHNQYQLTTPMNAAASYTNTFFHETVRYWNDFTENGVVFILDVAPVV